MYRKVVGTKDFTEPEAAGFFKKYLVEEVKNNVVRNRGDCCDRASKLE
jgi:hypothetical protein